MPIVRRALDPAITAAIAGTTGAGAGRAAIERQVYARGERELERQRTIQANTDQLLLNNAIRGGGGIDASGIIEHNRMIEGRKRPFGVDRSGRQLGGLGRLPRSRGRGSSGIQNDALADELDAARVDEARAETGRRDARAISDLQTDEQNRRLGAADILDRIDARGAKSEIDLETAGRNRAKAGYQAGSAYLDLQKKADEAVQRQDEVSARQAAVDGLRAHALRMQVPPALVQAATAELLGSGRISAAMMKNLGLAPPDAGGTSGTGGGISVGARDFVKIMEGGGYQAVLEASSGINPSNSIVGPGGTTIPGPSQDANEASAGFAAWLPRASAKEIEAVRKSPAFDQASPAVKTMVEAHLQHAQRAEAEAMAPNDMQLLQRETMKELSQIKQAMGAGGAAPALGAAQTMAAMTRALERLTRQAPEVVGRIRRILEDPNFADLRDELLRSLAGAGVPAQADRGSMQYPDSPE